MKEGQNLEDMALQLQSEKRFSRDLIVPTGHMSLENNDSGYSLNVGDEKFSMKEWPHAQIGTFNKIPKQYYDKIMVENPFLLSSMVNHGFQHATNLALAQAKKSSRMVRTVNGSVRGFLSSSYRRMDSYDLMEAVYPILMDNGFEVKSAQLTEKRMYVKAFTKKLEGEVSKGQVINYGISISSSDVGCGSLQIAPSLYECVCDNGMIMEQTIRKTHLGKNNSTEHIEELLTDETKKQEDYAFWMGVRDVVTGTLKRDVFDRELDKLKLAQGEKITNYKLDEVVELTMKEVGISGEKFMNSIVGQLANGVQGRGLNKWGLANAFTWAAHDVEDASYEEATELERAGGKIIELPKHAWERVAA